jgi:hypothetical protein
MLTAKSDGEDSVDSPSKNTDSAAEMDADDVGGDDEMLEVEGQVVDQGVPTLGHTAIPRQWRTKTVLANPARKSACLTGTATTTPVLQRTQERATAKNLELDTVSKFAVLPALSDPHLVSVPQDCGMAFETQSHTVTETISLIRAKEEVQVALALAVFCREVEAARVALPHC